MIVLDPSGLLAAIDASQPEHHRALAPQRERDSKQQVRRMLEAIAK
ncbi:MAG: hypothetical protein WD651_13445 [Acidimicrobiia bacterium]